MVRVRKRFGPLVINECWNGFDSKLLKSWFSFCSFFNISTEVRANHKLFVREYKTVCNDLRLSEKEIFSAFTKQTRNVIRQTQTMEIEFDMATKPDKFIPFFNAFARRMRIRRTSQRKLEEYGRHMEITSAYYRGVICVAHSYIADQDNKTVVLYQSASRRMIAADIDKALLAKVNKALHFEDIKFFKNRGFELYDFGGYFEEVRLSDEKKRGINDFKLLFGGRVVTYNNHFTPAFWYLNQARLFAGQRLLKALLGTRCL